MSNFGFVYMLSNQYMPTVVKIGCTERSPHARAKELSHSTGVPASFEVVCYIEVENFQAIEKSIHYDLGYRRVSENREFFLSYDPEQLIGLFRWHPSRLAFAIGPGLKEFSNLPSLEQIQNPYFVPPEAYEALAAALDEADKASDPLRLVANGGDRVG